MSINLFFLLSKSNLFSTIKGFVSSLTMIDVIFFFSIILLMNLVIILLYFIKLNDDSINVEVVKNNVVEEKEEVLENNILSNYNVEEDELIDLETITRALEKRESSAVELTKFEEDQENDAIISYDELISRTKNNEINYKKESMIETVAVKEVDVDNITTELNKENINEENINVNVISYREEEEFLKALKTLQSQLN